MIDSSSPPKKDDNSQPKISVVVCTRNRGGLVVQGLETIFANHYSQYEVILVDQSTNDETEKAVVPFQKYANFRYIHSDTVGTGRSRNIGLFNAEGEIVAYTDDDCDVPSNWLEKTAFVFNEQPKVALVYFDVQPGPHDTKAGYVPCYIVKKNRLLRRMRDSFAGYGLGAGMAIRRETFIAIGGFDNNLGPGSIFRSGEDRDIAIRALLAGWWVYDTNIISIVHYGFRSWSEGKAHTKRDWFSLGATYIKPLKCGHWNTLIVFFSGPILKGLFEPLINIFQLKKPRGFRRWIYYLQGALAGLRTPIDCKTILYKLD
ncbi:MAG: glycosyltransferase family 2 protein [Anaerolineales bacterium]|nr:glycosyltransferase family 2 protein [Anaerolineales bacterium]